MSGRAGRNRVRAVAFACAAALGAAIGSGFVLLSPAIAAETFLGDGRGGVVAVDRERLLETVRTRREVPVIVRMRGDFAPEGRLSLFQAANQRVAIAAAQRRVLDKVTGLRNITTFESVPMLAATVGAGELAALLRDTTVAAVYEDVAVPPALNKSVPLIRADAVAANRRVRGGRGWTVAVLDTGVQRSHPALTGKVVSEACFSTKNSISASLCPGGGYRSFARGAGRYCDLSIDGCAHGTHVSGIAVGNPKGNRRHFKGVANQASLIPIQVFSRFRKLYCGGASACVLSYTSDQLAALEYVNGLASRIQIAAVNMSLGGGAYDAPCDTHPLQPIIATLRSKKIAVVVAAGNGGADGYISAPGCISDAITVASTTLTDTVSTFSNFSRLVDLAAPGSDIVSSVPRNRFEAMSGTSMAAPHVAGAWALLRSRFPNASVSKIERALQCAGRTVKRDGVRKTRVNVRRAFRAVRNGCT